MHMHTRRRLRTVAVVAASAALLVGVAACGRADQRRRRGGGDIRIAIVTRDFTNPYWAALRDGAQAEGTKQGVTVEVQAGESETDSTGENAKLSTLAGQNYNCFGVVPVNATNVITPLVPVAQKKIPILNLDTQIDPQASQQAGVSYAYRSSARTTFRRAAGRPGPAAAHGRARRRGHPAGHRRRAERHQPPAGLLPGGAGKLNIVATQPADYDQAKAQDGHGRHP